MTWPFTAGQQMTPNQWRILMSAITDLAAAISMIEGQVTTLIANQANEAAAVAAAAAAQAAQDASDLAAVQAQVTALEAQLAAALTPPAPAA